MLMHACCMCAVWPALSNSLLIFWGVQFSQMALFVGVGGAAAHIIV